jgi:chemotaxis protein histidine kinase CheA
MKSFTPQSTTEQSSQTDVARALAARKKNLPEGQLQRQPVPSGQHAPKTAAHTHHLGRIPIFSPTRIQPKLTINAPGDYYEQEADHIADQVVQRIEHQQAPPAGASDQGGGSASTGTPPGANIQRKCADCAKESASDAAIAEKDEEQDRIQTKPLAADITPLIQRQSEPETEEQEPPAEEEEVAPVQTKPLENGRIQRQEDEAEAEETPEAEQELPAEEEDAAPVQTKALETTRIQRQEDDTDAEETPGEEVENTPEAQQEQQPPEKEAEEAPLQTKPLESNRIQRQEDETEAEETPGEEAENEQIQTKSDSPGGLTASPALGTQLHATKGVGQPLPTSTRTQMEKAFGNDFSGVRIHTDHTAMQMNKAVRAQAFTHGSDIYFGTGKFQPETVEGRRLLAHELVHVGQQNSNFNFSTIQRYYRHDKGTYGEYGLAFIFYNTKNGWILIHGPGGPKGHKVTARGFDIVAFNIYSGELHLTDNKAWVRKNITSATAISLHLLINLNKTIFKVNKMRLPFIHQIKILSLLEKTKDAIISGNKIPSKVKLVVTNAGGQSTGIDEKLKKSGIIFIDVNKPNPGRRVRKPYQGYSSPRSGPKPYRKIVRVSPLRTPSTTPTNSSRLSARSIARPNMNLSIIILNILNQLHNIVQDYVIKANIKRSLGQHRQEIVDCLNTRGQGVLIQIVLKRAKLYSEFPLPLYFFSSIIPVWER